MKLRTAGESEVKTGIRTRLAVHYDPRTFVLRFLDAFDIFGISRISSFISSGPLSLIMIGYGVITG